MPNEKTPGVCNAYERFRGFVEGETLGMGISWGFPQVFPWV